MTPNGSDSAAFRRAIERENLVGAEFHARVMGRLTLVEALELTALVALKDWRRCSRYAGWWLGRWAAEAPWAGSEDAAIVSAYLGALGGPKHGQAVALLREIAPRPGTRSATAQGRRRFSLRAPLRSVKTWFGF